MKPPVLDVTQAAAEGAIRPHIRMIVSLRSDHGLLHARRVLLAETAARTDCAVAANKPGQDGGSKRWNKPRAPQVSWAADEILNQRAVPLWITVNLENDDEDHVPDPGGRSWPRPWDRLADSGSARVAGLSVSAGSERPGLSRRRPQLAGRNLTMPHTILLALATPIGICVGVSLTVPLAALIVASLLGALLGPLDCSAERIPLRSQWPSGPVPHAAQYL
jgi:hypothetical protein